MLPGGSGIDRSKNDNKTKQKKNPQEREPA